MSVTTDLRSLERHTEARRSNNGPSDELSFGLIAVVLFGHAVYGLLVTRSAAAATLHALVTTGVGLWLAATSSVRQIALACAYMAGCQILWRIGRASIPWEFGKYAIALFAVIALSRMKSVRWDWPAVTYIALLTPSTLLSFSETQFEIARQQVSFNMSGPVALALVTWFALYMRPTRGDTKRLFFAMLAPSVSMAAVAFTGAIQMNDVSFSDASNFQASGGYGPNQVSSMLGLGALLAILLALLIEERPRGRLLFGSLAVMLGAQSALTFSRGGLYSALGALLLAAPFLIKGTRSRVTLFVMATVLMIAVEEVVVPRLDRYTGGAIVTRFQDQGLTGRDDLIRQELQTFAEHPLFGVGPAAQDAREGGGTVAVHTEFSRLLAQHGIFGFFALIAMLVIAWRAVALQQGAAGRALAVALLAWSALTMSHAAMRLALVPFAYGLASATFFAGRRPRAETGSAPALNASTL